MNNELKNAGFSLIEVLLAVGTLAIGMIFIGGTFLAGIHFSTIATERTIAAVASDEAFAKIKLFGSLDPNWLSALHTTECNDFSELVPVDANEFAYPSTPTDPAKKQYFWSALCRFTEPNTPANPNPSVQVTVFVSRKVGSGTMPIPKQVNVSGNFGDDVLQITGPLGDKTWINDGYTIADNKTGRIYRILERDPDNDTLVQLDKVWWDPDGFSNPDLVWVVPPPDGGGRYPCIVVYQTVIRF